MKLLKGLEELLIMLSAAGIFLIFMSYANLAGTPGQLICFAVFVLIVLTLWCRIKIDEIKEEKRREKKNNDTARKNM